MTVDVSEAARRDAVQGRGYAVRQGMLILVRPYRRPLDEALFGALCDAVKGDSRVSDFRRPPFREHQARSDLMYPRLNEAYDDVGLTGNDHFHAVRFSDPLVFRLSIPPENQEPFRGSRDFPTGDYFVAWDGITITVLWEADTSQRPSVAAGRVAFDVLEAAAKRARLGTYVQACSPGCKNRFTHVNALLARAEDEIARESGGGVVVFRRNEGDWITNPLEAVKDWNESVRYPFFLFAMYKNRARRIRDLMSLVGLRLRDLLALQQQHAASTAAAPKSRWRLAWSMRGWRKRSKKLMADIWLASVTIDVMTREWDESRRRFKNQARRHGFEALFKSDASDDEAAIDAYDATLAVGALDNFSTRLDTRSVVLVTALAAVAGLVGAFIGAAVAS